jgi:two-component system chemotaxis response regulator CheY
MSHRVLIADDSMTIRRILAKELQGFGVAEVIEAADGTEAVTAVTGSKFDLVLLDWNMPKMSGIDALREIRAKGLKVPIIMVTSEAEKSRVIQAIQTGANDYVVKPFTGQTLAAKVGRFIPISQAAS